MIIEDYSNILRFVPALSKTASCRRDVLFAEMEGYDIDEPSTMINCCDISNSK